MSIQINATTDAAKGLTVGNSGAGRPGAILETDNGAGFAADFSICLYWSQTTAPTSGGGTEYVLAEWNDGTNVTHVITVDFASGGAFNIRFRWRVGTAAVEVGNLQCTTENFAGQQWSIVASFRKDAVLANSDVYFAVQRWSGNAHVQAVTTLATDAVTVVTAIANSQTTKFSLGKDKYSAAGGSAPGIVIPTIRNDLIRDGTSGSVDFALIHQKHEPMQSILYRPQNVVWMANHAVIAVPWGGVDCRAGAAVGGLVFMDRSSSISFNNRFAVVGGVTVAGTPTNVDAYTVGPCVPSMIDRSSGDEAYNLNISRTTFSDRPLGSPDSTLSQFFTECNSLSFSRQWTAMYTANSRAVYSGTVGIVKTIAGTVTTITVPTNFNDAGWLSLVGPEYVVGYVNHPLQSGYDGLAPGTTEDAAALNAARAFGVDCADTSNLPLVADNSDVASNMYTATRTAGTGSVSKLWFGSRTGAGPGSYNSGGNEYYGPSSPRILLPGYSYRLLCKPINSFVTTEAFEMVFRFLDIPSASTIASYRKCGATSQIGADSLGASDSTLTGTGGGSMTQKQITAVAGSWTYNGNITPATRKTLTVDDTDNGLASFVAGDLIELVTSAGAALVTNVPDVSIIHTITGKGTATCVITVYDKFKVDPVASSTHYIKCRSAIDAIKTVRVQFAAGEVASNIWRGMRIKASNDGRTGLILLGVDFRNSTRSGVVVARCSWNGVGYKYQYGRLHHTAHATDGISWSQRCFAELNPNVVVMGTANQGDSNSLSAAAVLAYYDWLAAQTIAPHICTWASGPELAVDGASGDFSCSQNSVVYHLCFENVYYNRTGVVCTGWGYDQVKGFDQRVRYCTTGVGPVDDVWESATHPAGGKDLYMCMQQILFLKQYAAGASALTGGSMMGSSERVR